MSAPTIELLLSWLFQLTQYTYRAMDDGEDDGECIIIPRGDGLKINDVLEQMDQLPEGEDGLLRNPADKVEYWLTRLIKTSSEDPSSKIVEAIRQAAEERVGVVEPLATDAALAAFEKTTIEIGYRPLPSNLTAWSRKYLLHLRGILVAEWNCQQAPLNERLRAAILILNEKRDALAREANKPLSGSSQSLLIDYISREDRAFYRTLFLPGVSRDYARLTAVFARYEDAGYEKSSGLPDETQSPVLQDFMSLLREAYFIDPQDPVVDWNRLFGPGSSIYAKFHGHPEPSFFSFGLKPNERRNAIAMVEEDVSNIHTHVLSRFTAS